ncbi:MAG: tRNA (adenine-N1)-methyltransferase [Anaerolineales bacterium]|nr:tRNA (adenine-N1)-methyltransferase [Anaerolineales bacterium]
MDVLKPNQLTQEGDLVQLVSPTNKVYLFRLISGEQLHTHRGVVNFDDLIQIPWGSQVFSHQGSPFYIIQPSLSDILRETKRSTQILYPKDIGFILITMGIGPGSLVLEAGTGSGALTTALAWAVGPQGHIYSYEVRAEMQNLARKNLDKLGLLDRVTLKLRDIAEGFDEEGIDALFLDLPDPYEYMPQVRRALKSGGAFGSILPTTNQVSRLLNAFHPNGFGFIDVCEIMLRYYKANPDRLRPADRMVAHTGYLIFARSILPAHDASQ